MVWVRVQVRVRARVGVTVRVMVRVGVIAGCRVSDMFARGKEEVDDGVQPPPLSI